MKVLYIEPCKYPKVMDISLDGDAFRNLVHGDYGYCRFTDDVELVTNDIGKLIGLSPNRFVGHDLVCGPLFFSGTGYDHNGEYNYIDLSDYQILYLTNMFYHPLPRHEYLKYADTMRKWIKPEMIDYHNRKYPQFKVERKKHNRY